VLVLIAESYGYMEAMKRLYCIEGVDAVLFEIENKL
jgi:hypothetical protein